MCQNRVVQDTSPDVSNSALKEIESAGLLGMLHLHEPQQWLSLPLFRQHGLL